MEFFSLLLKNKLHEFIFFDLTLTTAEAKVSLSMCLRPITSEYSVSLDISWFILPEIVSNKFIPDQRL
jgi:hypothetical protein